MRFKKTHHMKIKKFFESHSENISLLEDIFEEISDSLDAEVEVSRYNLIPIQDVVKISLDYLIKDHDLKISDIGKISLKIKSILEGSLYSVKLFSPLSNIEKFSDKLNDLIKRFNLYNRGNLSYLCRFYWNSGSRTRLIFIENREIVIQNILNLISSVNESIVKENEIEENISDLEEIFANISDDKWVKVKEMSLINRGNSLFESIFSHEEREIIKGKPNFCWGTFFKFLGSIMDGRVYIVGIKGRLSEGEYEEVRKRSSYNDFRIILRNMEKYENIIFVKNIEEIIKKVLSYDFPIPLNESQIADDKNISDLQDTFTGLSDEMDMDVSIEAKVPKIGPSLIDIVCLQLGELAFDGGEMFVDIDVYIQKLRDAINHRSDDLSRVLYGNVYVVDITTSRPDFLMDEKLDKFIDRYCKYGDLSFLLSYNSTKTDEMGFSRRIIFIKNEEKITKDIISIILKRGRKRIDESSEEGDKNISDLEDAFIEISDEFGCEVSVGYNMDLGLMDMICNNFLIGPHDDKTEKIKKMKLIKNVVYSVSRIKGVIKAFNNDVCVVSVNLMHNEYASTYSHMNRIIQRYSKYGNLSYLLHAYGNNTLKFVFYKKDNKKDIIRNLENVIYRVNESVEDKNIEILRDVFDGLSDHDYVEGKVDRTDTESFDLYKVCQVLFDRESYIRYLIYIKDHIKQLKSILVKYLYVVDIKVKADSDSNGYVTYVNSVEKTIDNFKERCKKYSDLDFLFQYYSLIHQDKYWIKLGYIKNKDEAIREILSVIKKD